MRTNSKTVIAAYLTQKPSRQKALEDSRHDREMLTESVRKTRETLVGEDSFASVLDQISRERKH